MSTLPEPTQKRKLNISMMLKVPIDLEIEVLGVAPTNNYQADDKNEDKILFNLIGDSQPEVVIDGASLAKLDEDSQTLVSQIVDHLDQTDSFLSMFSQTQYDLEQQDKHERDIAESSECLHIFSKEDFTVIQSQISPHKNKNMLCFLDSFNDGFAFIVNTMGTVLFLGKLVNYSWD